MPEDRFVRACGRESRISIRVIGRRSGRAITLPVWCVLDRGALWLLPVHGARTQWYLNLCANPEITIKAGKERRELRATLMRSERAVREVVRRFGEKYKPEMVARLYPGPLDVAVKVKLPAPAKPRAAQVRRRAAASR
jgi:deazaflavin-dependent oxidoreductase (nitroreductase family)